jgi:hypothetical protein
MIVWLDIIKRCIQDFSNYSLASEKARKLSAFILIPKAHNGLCPGGRKIMIGMADPKLKTHPIHKSHVQKTKT